MANDARNPTFEAAIVAAADDAEAYSVYADWLQNAGDPRGELMALQLAGKDEAARAFLEQHAGYFLGPLAEHVKCYDFAWRGSKRVVADAFTWKNGFIHHARLAHNIHADNGWQGRLAQVLELLLDHPSGRFLRELTINENGDPTDETLDDLVAILARSAPPSLRKLQLGDEVSQISWYQLGDLGPLWQALPGLTSLEIQAGSFELGILDLPSLKYAEFFTGGLSKASALAIATARWPRIEHLDVLYGDVEYGGDASLAEVQPLLDRADLSSLRRLGLKNSMFADELCKLLPAARILKGIRELDLSMGLMTDEGAAALAAQRAAFSHLEVLDVSKNYLSPEGIELVKGLARRVETEGQREDDEYRYVSVGE